MTLSEYTRIGMGIKQTYLYLISLAQYKQLRYLISGTSSAAVELLSFILIYRFSNLLYFSNSLSFIFGIISGFILHKVWTFKGEQQFKTHQQFVAYITLAGVNFVATNIFIGLYVNNLSITPILGKFLAAATTLIWTYALSTAFIFRHRK